MFMKWKIQDHWEASSIQTELEILGKPKQYSIRFFSYKLILKCIKK